MAEGPSDLWVGDASLSNHQYEAGKNEDTEGFCRAPVPKVPSHVVRAAFFQYQRPRP
jgi:hypothetical protein